MEPDYNLLKSILDETKKTPEYFNNAMHQLKPYLNFVRHESYEFRISEAQKIIPKHENEGDTDYLIRCNKTLFRLEDSVETPQEAMLVFEIHSKVFPKPCDALMPSGDELCV